MKSLTLFSSVIVLSLVAGCVSPGSDSYNPSYGTNTVMSDQKTAYVQATINHLNDIERKIDGWKVEAKEASGSSKETRYDVITSVEKKLDTARLELNKLKVASVSEYKSSKETVDKAVADLDKEFETSAKSFR